MFGPARRRVWTWPDADCCPLRSTIQREPVRGQQGRRSRIPAAGGFRPDPVLSGTAVQGRPGLESADEVGGAGQSEALQGVCSEAGAVALIADDDDPPGVVACHRQPMGAGGIEPPFENVSVNNDGTGQLAVAVPLIDRPGVNNKGARRHFLFKSRGVDAVEPPAAFKQQFVDRQRPGGGAGDG